jgi:DNA invertase Pin-like site-specific DNA recombinase
VTVQPLGPIDTYARVSRLGDKEQRSTAGQIEACRAVLADRGLPAGVVHVDDGRSAWNPRVKRPGWDALMGRLESGAAGGVIVFDLERFTRQPEAEGGRLIKAAERGLVVLDSDAEFDLTTASGKKAFRDAMAAAAYYSDRLSDRVKRGKRRKAVRGEVNPGSENHRAFGFEPDNVTVRESEAAVLRALTEHFLHGDSQDALIAWLGRMGVPTSYGNGWTRGGLKQLLVRERNAGWLVHGGVPMGRLPGEPIIDEETFGRVVAKYAARSPGRPPSPAYLCSGAAFCVCGHKLTGRPLPNCRPYEDGSVRREYRCMGSGRGGCGRVHVDQRALDWAARELTLAVLADPRNAAQIEAALAQRADQLDDLAALIADAEQTARLLDERLERGEMDGARYISATAALDKRLAGLKARRDALTAEDAPVPAVIGDLPGLWDRALPAERRSLLRQALRGRSLVVGPPDPDDPGSVARRLTVSDRR